MLTSHWNVRFKPKYPCNISELTQQPDDRKMINVFSVVFYEKVRSVCRKVKFDGNLFKRNLPSIFYKGSWRLISSAIAQILVRNEISLAKPNNVPKSD